MKNSTYYIIFGIVWLALTGFLAWWGFDHELMKQLYVIELSLTAILSTATIIMGLVARKRGR